jgi:uncharacterized membrane protein (Fun14 family)
MDAVESLKWATRDLIGGAAGGLVAGWSLRGISDGVITLLGILLVLLMAFAYGGLEALTNWTENLGQKHRDPQPERIRNEWPPHRGS